MLPRRLAGGVSSLGCSWLGLGTACRPGVLPLHCKDRASSGRRCHGCAVRARGGGGGRGGGRGGGGRTPPRGRQVVFIVLLGKKNEYTVCR
jgi:hypothetical protein